MQIPETCKNNPSPDSIFNELKTIRTNSKYQGFFDLVTYSIYAPNDDRFDKNISLVLAHELSHFLQFSATPFGAIHNNLNIDIFNAGNYLLSLLNDFKYSLKIPLFQYIEELIQIDICFAEKALPHFNQYVKSIKLLERLGLGKNVESLPNERITSIEIDLDSESFIVNGIRHKFTINMLLESMSWCSDRNYSNLILNRTNTWILPIDEKTYNYWLPWVYLHLKGDNGGIPYYLMIISWISLFQSVVESNFDQYGYGYRTEDCFDCYTSLYLKLLIKGPQGSVYFEKEMEEKKFTSDNIFNAINRTMHEIGYEYIDFKYAITAFLKSIDKNVLFYQELTSPQNTFTYTDRNMINLLFSYTGKMFLEAALTNPTLFFLPITFYSGLYPSFPRPVIFYQNGITYPNLPNYDEKILLWNQFQMFLNKLFWGTSLECYDPRYGSFYSNPHVGFNCQEFNKCKLIPDKEKLNFCHNENYHKYTELALHDIGRYSLSLMDRFSKKFTDTRK
jgi:hypothetical protein